jgi:hypothetical protein
MTRSRQFRVRQGLVAGISLIVGLPVAIASAQASVEQKFRYVAGSGVGGASEAVFSSANTQALKATGHRTALDGQFTITPRSTTLTIRINDSKARHGKGLPVQITQRVGQTTRWILQGCLPDGVTKTFRVAAGAPTSVFIKSASPLAGWPVCAAVATTGSAYVRS